MKFSCFLAFVLDYLPKFASAQPSFQPPQPSSVPVQENSYPLQESYSAQAVEVRIYMISCFNFVQPIVASTQNKHYIQLRDVSNHIKSVAAFG